MNTSLFSIGILNPLGFVLAVPVITALIYAYLRKQKLIPLVIPSFFLMRDLARPVSTRRRFVPPLRFWFELVLLLLLLLCFVGIFNRTMTERYALVIDNSLSSAALSHGKSVLQRVKEDLLSASAGLPGNTVFNLYRTSPQVERLAGVDLKMGELSEVLKQVVPAFATDNFNDALPQIIQREQYSRLMIFTDRQLELSSEAAENRKSISIHAFKAPGKSGLQNLALSDISLERNLQGDGSEKINVSVSAFSQSAIDVPVIIDSLKKNVSATAADAWQMLDKKLVALKPGETKSLSFSLEDWNVPGVRVRIDSENMAPELDTLREDNQLFLSFKSEDRLVYVVSARTIAELGIDQIRGVQFKALSLADFQRVLLQNDSATYLLVDFVPNGLPDKNVIIISPPEGTAGFEVGKVVQGAELTEWRAGHALLTYIDTASIRLSRFVPLVSPLWGEEIISTNKGAALIAGERGARRTVVAGFDLFPYRGRTSPTISVLFLNMLRWVSADPLGGRFLSPYEPIILAREASKIRLFGIGDAGEEFIKARDQSTFIPQAPGIYQVLESETALSTSAVNFISVHESDFLSTEEVLTGLPNQLGNEKLERNYSLSEFLIPLLLAILVIDLFYLLYGSLIKDKRARSANFRKQVIA